MTSGRKENEPDYCLAPLRDIEPSAFSVPAGACDTHAHVISADRAYPMSPARSYTPPPAPEEDYLRMLDATGMTYGVLVQISVYGTDNRCMIDVLRRHPGRLRGVAVVAPDVSDSELQSLHDAGVRGVRINVLFGGGIGLDAMETLAHRVAEIGWHVQFLLDGRQLPELMPRMKRLPCACVIDHMGHMPAALGTGHPGFQTLRHLLTDHGYWVKLSGAYRLSDQFEHYSDVVPIARALIDAAPDRVVWGSDWPHVSIPRMPNTGRLRNALPEWAPDETQRRRILVDNPMRLYGFGGD